MRVKRIMGIVTASLVLGTVGGAVRARSLSATAGHARLTSGVSSFTYDFNTGAAMNIGGTSNDFIVPLVIDSSGSKAVNFTATQPTSSFASCRAVANNRLGTSLSASSFAFFPVGSFGAVGTGAVSVPGSGTFFLDCEMTSNSQILEIDYNP